MKKNNSINAPITFGNTKRNLFANKAMIEPSKIFLALRFKKKPKDQTGPEDPEMIERRK